MQALLVLLVVAGSSAWLAMDASKRDWTDNSFAKNVPTWVAGSLLLWPIVFPLYVFAHRKKAPLVAQRAKPAPAPAVATEGVRPAEQYGPAVDEVAAQEPQAEPVAESVVEVAPEPVVEVVQGPVIEFAAPEPAVQADAEPDRVTVMEHEPVVEIQREPEPVVELEQDRVVETQPEPEFEAVVAPQPDPVVELEPEPDPVVELEPEPDPVVEPEPAAESEPDAQPVVEISHPELPAEQAPPGLSVDAFKDMKPVAFAGAPIEDDPVATPPPAAPEPEPEPQVEPEPAFGIEPLPEVEPLSYPAFEAEPAPALEPEPELAPEPAVAAATAEPAGETPVEQSKKRGFRIPKPELKLPKITLPANLEGPLSEVERKIALVSVLGIVAAGALGFATAPSDDAAAPAPPPAPSAATR